MIVNDNNKKVIDNIFLKKFFKKFEKLPKNYFTNNLKSSMISLVLRELYPN